VTILQVNPQNMGLVTDAVLKSQNSTLQSRYVGFVDVPEPKELKVNFTYNFFEPEERTDKTGKEKYHGTKDEIEQWENKKAFTAAKQRIPRFIEIMFSETNCGNDVIDIGNKTLQLFNELKTGGNANSEESLTTKKDTASKISDPFLKDRLSSKINLLLDILEINSKSVLEQSKEISDLNDTINKDYIREILKPINDAKLLEVNEISQITKEGLFNKAAALNLHMLLDRNYSQMMLTGDFTNISLGKVESIQALQLDSATAVVNNDDETGSTGFVPNFKVFVESDAQSSPEKRLKSMTLGYIINRKEYTLSGKFVGSVDFYLKGKSNTSYIDTKVVYGARYTYSVKTIALLEKIEEIAEEFKRVWILITSKLSKDASVKTMEGVPPLEPDGIFYRYNPEGIRGLAIRWQVPVGKQRDTKFFQIFRRKSIYEPFSCVAELDFDDSTIRTARRETVNNDRVHRLSGPTTFYIDPEFTRDSKYIYSVVAIDAHGLTSGYGAQTLVSFDKIKNTINLKNISRSGAPKQYPNFFVDPKLDDNVFVDSISQDVMLSSHKKKIMIYFDPDAITFTSGDIVGADATNNGIYEAGFGTLVKSKSNNAVYKLHLINIDRQKSKTVHLEISDNRT